jgi:hypothetical protein
MLVVALVACLSLSSCSSGVDFPNGSSKGYRSARTLKKDPAVETTAEENAVHRQIQKALAAEFASKGLQYGAANADLIVSYLVVYQDNIMTTFYDAYFGTDGDPEEISELAHKRGVVEGKRPEAFERAGLVISIYDAKTNELVHRDYAAGDIVRGLSDSVRQKRISEAVTIALRNFFN